MADETLKTADETELDDDETITCEAGECMADATTEHDGTEMCADCHAELVFTCTNCEYPHWVDGEKAASGTCTDCQADADADLEGLIADLIGDDRGHEVRAALKAAGLID